MNIQTEQFMHAKNGSQRLFNFVICLFVFILFSSLTITYLKSYISHIFGIRSYFWFLTYEYGLIRRGLVGTMVSPLRQYVDDDQLFLTFISNGYHLVAFSIMASLLCWVIVLALHQHNIRIFSVTFAALFLIFVSPFVGNQAYNSGWLDVLLMGLGAACFACVRHRFYAAAGVIGCIGVLAHEAFLFFWTPAIFLLVLQWLGSERSRGLVARLALTAFAPVIIGIFIGITESHTAIDLTIKNIDVDDNTIDALRDQVFSQTPISSFFGNIERFKNFPLNFIMSFAYVMTPVILTIIVALLIVKFRIDTLNFWGGKFLAVMALLGIGLGPLIAVLFVWDLSRVLSWTGFSALLLLVEVLSPSPGTPLSHEISVNPKSAIVILASYSLLALVYLSSPMVYSYFSVADLVLGPAERILPDFVVEGPQTKALAVMVRRYSAGHEHVPFLQVPGGIICELQHNPAVSVSAGDASCVHRIQAGGVAYGPYLRLKEGSYGANFRFASTEDCRSGRGIVEVVSGEKLFGKATINLVEGKLEVSLKFQVDVVDAAGRNLEFRTSVGHGCLALHEIIITESTSSDGSGVNSSDSNSVYF